MFRFEAPSARNSWLLRSLETMKLGILGAKYESMN